MHIIRAMVVVTDRCVHHLDAHLAVAHVVGVTRGGRRKLVNLKVTLVLVRLVIEAACKQQRRDVIRQA